MNHTPSKRFCSPPCAYTYMQHRFSDVGCTKDEESPFVSDHHDQMILQFLSTPTSNFSSLPSTCFKSTMAFLFVLQIIIIIIHGFSLFCFLGQQNGHLIHSKNLNDTKEQAYWHCKTTLICYYSLHWQLFLCTKPSSFYGVCRSRDLASDKTSILVCSYPYEPIMEDNYIYIYAK